MAKRFKLKLSRVIPSLQFCRPKHPSTFPENPRPAKYGLSPLNPKAVDIGYPILPAPPPSTPEQPSTKLHVSSKITSIGCGCRSRSCKQYLSSECSTESPDYSWIKEAKWHVVARARDDKPLRASPSFDSSCDISPVYVTEKKKKQKENKMIKKVKASISSRDSGLLSSEDEENEEAEALISLSQSFSIDSSYEFDRSFDSTTDISNTEIKCGQKKVNNIKKIGRLRRYVSKNYKGANVSKSKTVASPEVEYPARASVLRRMIPCTVDGKVRESVAVEKKSKDPYEDFKRSMLEMILEKQMFDAKDLEQLLQCFLSLNSRQYHRLIVEAFMEIWEDLFSDFSVKGQQPVA